VDEATWLNTNELRALLEHLRGQVKARQLRLFGCDCCRRFWHLFTDDRCRRAVELAERYVDDPTQREPFQASLEGARHAIEETFGPLNYLRAHLEQMLTSDSSASIAVLFLAWRMEGEAFQDTIALAPYAASRRPGEAERKRQCDVLRDIVVNPFWARPAIDLSWLRWNDGTIPRIAQGIYEERAFDRMPILADSLLDAGCDNEDILAHCRPQGAIHARGCWVIDLLLGKE